MRSFKYLYLLALTGLSGCAVAPESIAPSYVSEVPYDSYTCPQLSEEFTRVSEALAVASKQQSDARTGDTVGVILLGLPVSSLSGSNVASQVASLKGQEAAVQQASIKKNCVH
jgi:hypothetical protein